MPILLVLLFVGVPLLEIIVIQQVGSMLGWGWTLALLVADSLIGAWLLRIEGRRAWSQFRAALGEGRWPGDEVAQGALVIVGGTLLLAPGFVTDVVGFLLLVAPTRRAIAAILRSRMAGSLVGGPAAQQGGARVRREESRAAGLDVEVVDIRREPLPPSAADAARGEDGDPDATR